MAELGNLTYNVTVNDEVTKELEQLKEAVSSLQLRMTFSECDKFNAPNIDAYSELIGKYVEEQYKKLLEKEAAKEKSYDDYLKEWETIISESSLGNGKLVCCGMGVGIGPENKMPPSIVQDGLYINQSMIKDSTIQSDNYKEASSGWKLGKNGELELNTKTSKVVIDNEVLELFDKNGTLRVRVQL